MSMCPMEPVGTASSSTPPPKIEWVFITFTPLQLNPAFTAIVEEIQQTEYTSNELIEVIITAACIYAASNSHMYLPACIPLPLVEYTCQLIRREVTRLTCDPNAFFYLHGNGELAYTIAVTPYPQDA